MKSNKPFKKGDKKRLFRVCDAVKASLLGDIPCTYEFAAKDETTLASSYIYYAGWRGRIRFYNLFFGLDLKTQLETIVHEFIHLSMQPLDQQLHRMRGMLTKTHLPIFQENCMVAREIAVDRLSGYLTPLLMPVIAKAL